MLSNTSPKDAANEVEIFVSGSGRLFDLKNGSRWWHSGSLFYRSATRELGPFQVVAAKEKNSAKPIEFNSRKESVALAELDKLLTKVISRLTDKFGFNNDKNDGTTEESPLLVALEEADIELAADYIQKMQFVSQANSDGTTPLHLAIKGGYLDLVELLIDIEQVNIEAVDSELTTALHMASDKGYLQVVQALLERRPDVNSVDKSGRTPLHYAVFEGHFDVVRFLASNKANPDAKDVWGHSPLDYAVMREKKDIAAFLVTIDSPED